MSEIKVWALKALGVNLFMTFSFFGVTSNHWWSLACLVYAPLFFLLCLHLMVSLCVCPHVSSPLPVRIPVMLN